MADWLALEPLDLALALVPMGGTLALSSWQRLELEGQIVLATGRACLQLAALGYALGAVFVLDAPWAVALALAVMITVAALAARNRISRRLPRLLPLTWGALLASSALTLGYVLVAIGQPPSWHDPQYLIPLAGMTVGNAASSATIAGERLVDTLSRSRSAIETHLSLGATPRQAATPYRQAAVRAGMLPALNQMSVVGLATLPGLLAGQLLGGIDPLNAAAYQGLVLVMQAAASAVATLLVAEGVYRQFFNRNAQLIDPR